MSGIPPASRMSRIQAQFQQKQMQEKEAKLLQMLDNQQQRVLEKAQGMVNKYSSVSSTPVPPGKVRQMFEERRKGPPLPLSNPISNSNSNGGSRNGTLIGIDKSYPLEPIQTPPTKVRSMSSSTSQPQPPLKRPVGSTPALKPINLGSSNKPSREALPIVLPKSSSSSNPSPVQSLKSPIRSQQNKSKPASLRTTPTSPSEEYSNSLKGTPPPPATTTKYSDYANELEKREASLASKLKGMDLTDGGSKRTTPTPIKSPIRKATPSSISGSKPKSPANKPSSPVKKGPPPTGLDECKMCGRYFAPDRIAKHETICKKVKTKKRKAFDPTKMRMQGTEAEPYIRIVSAKKINPNSKNASQIAAGNAKEVKKQDWRKKHEDFIKTIRAAKEYQAHVARGGDPADLPPPPPSDNSDYIKCPHCNRKFAEGAANRHIPKCQNIKSNKR